VEAVRDGDLSATIEKPVTSSETAWPPTS
jgi:hypothetical protein